MADDFDTALSDFQKWAGTQKPEFAAGVNAIIGSHYLANLGEGMLSETIPAPKSVIPATNTVDKLTDFINNVGSVYLNSVDAYYTAKGKVADLKAKAQGSVVTQVLNPAGMQPSNLLIYGGVALLAVVLLSRR